MKKLAYLVIPLAALALMVGCGTTPTKLDTALFNVQTNYVPVLVLKTNVVTQVNTVTVTNEVGIPTPVYVTNITSVIMLQTNQVPQYILTGPSQTSTAVAGVAGTAGNIAAPGTGSLITGGLLGLLSIFLGIRNRQMNGQNNALSQAAGSLAQTIETARELMASTPQGQKAADAFTQWMVTHQAQAGTIAEITNIVKSNTDNVQAQAAANQILALMGQPAAAIRPPT